MAEVIGICPICSGDFNVSQLNYSKCESILKGNFELCEFCKLTKEQKYFIKMLKKQRQ